MGTLLWMCLFLFGILVDAAHHEGHMAQISSFQWGIEPFSMTRGQASDLTVTLQAAAHDSTDNIHGRGLWRVGIFGAEREDGSGRRVGYQRQILDDRQAGMSLSSGTTLDFRMNTRFDMSAVGCPPYTYFCIEFGRGEHPSVDFNLPTPSGDNTMVACKARECAFPGGGNQLSTAGFQRFSFSAQPTGTQHGLTTMDITVTGTGHANSDTIEGEGLWRVAVFGSRNSDGSGIRRNENSQILDAAAARQTLYPGRDLVLSATPTLDLRGVGGSSDFPYLCVEFTKGQYPSPDYRLSLEGEAILQCSAFAGPEQYGPQAVIGHASGSVGSVGQPFADGTTNVQVRATLTPHEQSDRIDGQNLWKLGIFGSSNSEGTGPRYQEVPQILYPQEAGQSLIPGTPLEFDVTRPADIRGIGPGTSYPYMCMEFNRNELSYPEFRMADSIVMCQELQHQGGGGGGGAHGQPQALFNQFSYSMDNIPVENSQRRNAQIQVSASATPRYESDDIPEGNNWRLGLFGSRNSDGTGPRRNEVHQILPRQESRQPAYPGRPLNFDAEPEVDLTDIGTGTAYPYLCVEFQKLENANFNMLQTFVACDEVAGGTGSSGSGSHGGNNDNQGRNVMIVNYSGGFSQESPTDDSGTTEMRITAQLTPHEGSDSLSGTDLWRLGVFGSEREDGSGSRKKENSQVLSQRHASYPVYPPRPLDFDFVVPLDLRGVGRNTRYPYLCLEFAKGQNPNPDFNLQLGSAESIILCTEPNGNFNSPEPSVNLEDFRGSLRQTGQPRNDGTTPMAISVSMMAADDSLPVTGRNNWRLGVFGSQNGNGAGTRKREVTQILEDSKASLTVQPGRELSITTTANVDLRGIGGGTDYPYLCLEFAKGDNPRPDFNMGGSAVMCSEWDPSSSGGDHGGEEERPQVYVKSIKPSKITITQQRSNHITFDVTVGYDAARTTDINSHGVWELAAFGSKKKNGKGPKVALEDQTLSYSQRSSTLDSSRPFTIRDISYNLDMTGETCKKVKYLCATLSSTDSSVKVKGKPTGCMKLKCNKKASMHGISGGTLTQDIRYGLRRSISPSRVRTSTVTVREGEINNIAFSTDVAFTGNPIEGRDLWRLATWFSAEPNGNGPKVAFNDQTLSDAQKSMNVPSPANGLSFENIRMVADLRDVNCRDIRYLCTRLKKNSDAFPDFDFETGANTGCVVVACAKDATVVEDIVMPIVSPTHLETTSAIVNTGQVNRRAMDITVHFDFDRTQIVSGRHLWKVIVWLSDKEDGTGSKIGKTQQVLSDIQVNMPLMQGRPLVFKNIQADFDLTNIKCKKVTHICAKFKSLDPKPRFVMNPGYVVGCSPAFCQ